MKLYIKAAFAVIFFLSIISVYAQTNSDIKGVWYKSNDVSHSIHFYNNGTFTEKTFNNNYSGSWTVSPNGVLTFTYKNMTPNEIRIFDNVSYRGSDMVWTVGGVETIWVRGNKKKG